jgi:hypothetical protein
MTSGGNHNPHGYNQYKVWGSKHGAKLLQSRKTATTVTTPGKMKGAAPQKHAPGTAQHAAQQLKGKIYNAKADAAKKAVPAKPTTDKTFDLPTSGPNVIAAQIHGMGAPAKKTAAKPLAKKTAPSPVHPAAHKVGDNVVAGNGVTGHVTAVKVGANGQTYVTVQPHAGGNKLTYPHYSLSTHSGPSASTAPAKKTAAKKVAKKAVKPPLGLSKEGESLYPGDYVVGEYGTSGIITGVGSHGFLTAKDSFGETFLFKPGVMSKALAPPVPPTSAPTTTAKKRVPYAKTWEGDPIHVGDTLYSKYSSEQYEVLGKASWHGGIKVKSKMTGVVKVYSASAFTYHESESGSGPAPVPSMPSAPTPSLSALTEQYYPSSAAAGYTIPDFGVSANGSWKPTASQREGLRRYSGNAYITINSQLRHGSGATGGTEDTTIAQMDSAFNSVPPLDHNIVVARKMFGNGPFPLNPPPMSAGAIFQDNGYVSTSKSANAWDGNTSMEIRVPAGKKVIDLNHTSGSENPDEREVLLPRSTRFRVISDTANAGSRRIVVEVV